MRRQRETAEALAEVGALLCGGVLFVAQGVRLTATPLLHGAGWWIVAAGVCAIIGAVLRLGAES